MSHDVEDINFTRKSKKQNKAVEDENRLVRVDTLEEKLVKIQHKKHVLGVAVVTLIRHSVQR